MNTERDDLHQQFFVQCGNSAIEAIDDAVLASTDHRLEQSAKDQVAEVLLAGFSHVLNNKTIGKSDQVTAKAIHKLIAVTVADREDSDLEAEITEIVLRAFLNFAEGLSGLVDDEIGRRQG